MKRILTGTLALVLFAGVAQAQKQDTERHFKNDGRIKKELNLTADQQTKLQSIREMERKDMKALRNKYQDQRQSVFTPDQRKKLESLKAERKQHAKGMKHHGKHKNFKKRAEFQRQLNLTQDQKERKTTKDESRIQKPDRSASQGRIAKQRAKAGENQEPSQGRSGKNEKHFNQRAG